MKWRWEWGAPLVLGLVLAGGGGGAQAQKDIRDTKHNLSGVARSSPGGLSAAEDRRRLEREVCVFCHTPSAGAAEGAGSGSGQSPLWQRTVPDLSFDLFDDIGRAADAGGAVAVGSVSVACLSCHDSSQAFGVAIVNGEDHPFGMPYRGSNVGRAEMKDIRQQLAAGGLPFRFGWRIDDSTEFRPARTTVVNRRQIWWASSAGGTQRTKTDLPLYPRAVRENDRDALLVPFVECTSCHDPHSIQPLFLRVQPGQGRGSLCLSCHIQ